MKSKLLRSSRPLLLLLAASSSCDLETKPSAPIADPTIEKSPKATTSLALDENWVPPEPTRSTVATRKERVTAPTQFGVSNVSLSSAPSDEQIRAWPGVPDPIVPMPGISSSAETTALAAALNAYASATDSARGDPIVQFIDAYPGSRWAPSLLLNLGTIAYDTGYFTDALVDWRRAWDLAKTHDDPISEAIANLAIAEYAKMSSRVGRQEELDVVFEEVRDRVFQGDARSKMMSASEGRWMMEHRPEVSFRCGPYALASVAPLVAPELAGSVLGSMRSVASPPTGFSLSEVHAMSESLGLGLQMARRAPGSAIITPAVVHWKVGHFGALLREQNGSYLLEDPTFGNQVWMSARAIDQEATGFFLVPAGALPSGWRAASEQEAGAIFGKGHSGNGPPFGGGPYTNPNCPNGQPMAMAVYSFDILLASVHISDTPTGYSAAVGPEVRVQVAYNQHEAEQPSSLTFTNFGPLWVSNFVSYLEDNTTNASANITLHRRGGGYEIHTGYNSGTQNFALDPRTKAYLHRINSNTYVKRYEDGTEEYYEQYIGTTGTQRKVFLSRIKDAQGQEVALTYDSTYPTRVNQIVDATGLPTVFSYTYSGQPYLVTEIEDPFGREATMTYTTVASALRLQSIEDAFGIVSSFSYSSAGEITSFTTPYGTTSFSLSPLTLGAYGGLIRFVESTDPYGSKERIEYNLSTAITGVPATLTELTPDSAVVKFTTTDNDDRNSFYWDKMQMKIGAGDYTKAHLYHWLQPDSLDATIPILESEKPALEGRIWYNYPGQNASYPWIQGTLGFPSVRARLVENAAGTKSTQAYKYSYNSLGNVTSAIDPTGREVQTNYDTNGIDVLTVKQKTGASSWATLATYTYDVTYPPHSPKTVTDGAGKTTTYTYNSLGQVATVTNPKSEVTTFTYETTSTNNGYRRILSITGDVPGGNRSFTYDSQDRLLTTTDSEGYVLTYDYDDLDRVRVVTYPDSSTEQYEYADHSLVASKDRADRWTRHAYNQLRERVLTRDPKGQVNQFQWCRCTQLRRLVDGNGNVTEWPRDVQGRPTKKVYADGSDVEYTYDYSGRLRFEVDPMSRTKSFEYTQDDRLSKLDYSDSGTADVTYAYDTWFPRLTSRVDGIGTTSYVYNAVDGTTLGAGQVARINGPFTDDTLKYTYDDLGRVKKTQIVDDSTYTTATYSDEATFDARGRVTGVANNLGSFTYAYVGQSGRVDYVDFPNGMKVDYTYLTATSDFLLSQIKNLSSGGSPTTISQFDYTYNQDRTIATWAQLQNSVTTTWTFGYDPIQQLVDAVRRNSGGSIITEEHYGFDAAGNRVQTLSGSTPKNATVDNLNQLVSERGYGKTRFAGTLNEKATVTVNGQPAEVTSTAGGAPYKFEAEVDLASGSNTVTVVATDGNSNVRTNNYSVTTTGVSKQFEYDANGSTRYEKNAGGTVLREFQWDQENRLVKIVDGVNESRFEYDGESHRTRIKELVSSSETSNKTFVWCEGRICQRRASNGTTVERSYDTNGFEESSTDYFYTKDQLGSVREVVASNGTTVASVEDFDPWGTRTHVTGSGASSDFGYTGHYNHQGSAFALAQYRAYSSASARWQSRDPIQEAGGINLYGYVGDDPISQVDPLGLAPGGMTGGEMGLGKKKPWETEFPCSDFPSYQKQCEDQCRPRGGVAGCRVRQTIKPYSFPANIKMEMFCRCKDDDQPSFCAENPAPCVLVVVGVLALCIAPELVPFFAPMVPKYAH